LALENRRAQGSLLGLRLNKGRALRSVLSRATLVRKPESEDQAAPIQPPAEAPSYTAPSFYGSARQIFTAGQGRFARPKFRYGASVGIGFDDNINQTPDNAEDIPKQTFEQVIPAEPEVVVFQPRQVLVGQRTRTLPNGTVQHIPIFRTVQDKIVLRPAQPEQVVETEVPGIDFGERQSSLVSRLDLNADVQWANPRTVFTMDLRGGTEYYWSRDQNPLEYNGALAFLYLRRISPRVQVSANANSSTSRSPIIPKSTSSTPQPRRGLIAATSRGVRNSTSVTDGRLALVRLPV
jgi:hypothetical protein